VRTDTVLATQSDQPELLGATTLTVPQLFVVLEGERPHAGGVRYSLGEVDEVTIGRGEERRARLEPVGGSGRRRLDLRLPSSLLSMNHLRITHEDEDWIIEDTGSRNGSYLNRRSLTREIVRDGDLIEIGRVVLRFRMLGLSAEEQRRDTEESAVAGPLGFHTLLPALALEFHELARIAASPLPILLLGETGTGKEVLARAIHQLSSRPGPLVAVNCGALSGSLLDSQLFGHVRGAFTGSLRDELGLVRASDGGTLFLDEIGDLPGPAQAALLRVLQEREVVPVGATRPVAVDLRVIAATHRQLDLLSARGEFRADLYARLSAHVHYLTPLRDRREDLGLILADLLPPGSSLRLSADACRALVTNDWPLNIRQLEQSLTRATTLAEQGVIHARHLVPPSPRTATPERPGERAAETRGADDRGREAELITLLTQHRGNVSEIARSMGCSRMQVHRWMQRYGLSADTFRR
jgi:transcriptional regulator with PAS, ATPase and Fis domain